MLSLEEKYKLAASLAIGQRDQRLLHGRVRPTWADDSSCFWYATRTSEGIEYVLIDVASQSRSPLIDRDALAAALINSSKEDVDASALGLADIRFTPKTNLVEFSRASTRWRWHRGPQILERVEESYAPDEAPSPDRSAAVRLENGNLWLRENASVSGRALTDDGVTDWGYGDYADGISEVSSRLRGKPKPVVLWSPDSQSLAVVRADRRKLPLNHLIQSVPAAGARPVLHSYRYVTPPDDVAVELELWFIGRDGSRVLARLPGFACRGYNPLAFGHGWWAPDGLFFDIFVAALDWTHLALWRVDTRTGESRKLAEEEGGGIVLSGPELRSIPMWRVLEDGRVITWSQQRDGWGHLYLNSPGDPWRAITRGRWLVRSILHIDEGLEEIIFTANGMTMGENPYYVHAYKVRFDGIGLVCLSPEVAYHEFTDGVRSPPATADGSHSVSPDGRYIVDSWSTSATAPKSVLRATADGAILMELETAIASDNWPEAIPAVETFSVRALDADRYPGCSDLWGALYKPADFDPTRRYPVIEVIYGGPQVPIVGHGWSGQGNGNLAEQLTALGFVVVMLDGPGTPDRSLAFQMAVYGNLESCGSLPDHVNAIRHLSAARPWMNIDRVGIVGASGGGYATVRAMSSYQEFYKVGVAICGNHDNAAYSAAWGDMYQGPYTEDSYRSQSNIPAAAGIVGKLMLIHGDMDDNVHPSMTMQIVNALISVNRNFDFLMVPNAGHDVFMHAYVQRRIFDFFVEHLGGLTPPKPVCASPADATRPSSESAG